jgi:hypothetical protein
VPRRGWRSRNGAGSWGHVATNMPAMKMSSSWKEEQVERGESMVVFSASSIKISWSRQLALQNAFSPLQQHSKNVQCLFLAMLRPSRTSVLVTNYAQLQINSNPICLR